MFCTSKERETCDVEKRTCTGCYYENETPEKKIERLEIVKDMLDGEVKLLRKELQQEKEKNKKLEEEAEEHLRLEQFWHKHYQNTFTMLQQEIEKNKKLEEENKYLQDYLEGMEGGLKEQIKEQQKQISELQAEMDE